jgi:hypothetical protein
MVAGEKTVWATLWKTPQAVMWDRLGWTRTVARYCRLVVQAEQVGADVKVLGEARQLEDRLGLTPKAMLSLRWKITADEVDEQRKRPARPRSKDRRDRLKAVV